MKLDEKKSKFVFRVQIADLLFQYFLRTRRGHLSGIQFLKTCCKFFSLMTFSYDFFHWCVRKSKLLLPYSSTL